MARYHLKLNGIRVLEKRQLVAFEDAATAMLDEWANHSRRMGELALADWLDEIPNRFGWNALRYYSTQTATGPVTITAEKIS